MSTQLLTEQAKSADLVRINATNNALAKHAQGGLDTHDSEGVVSYTISDSHGDNTSLLSLVLGGVDPSGNPLKVHIPLAQNPTPVIQPAGQFLYTFVGVLFTGQDDFSAATSTLTTDILADPGLTADEKTAITSFLTPLAYSALNETVSVVVNAVKYTFTVVVTPSTGFISITYNR
jgi:hypothetical protein